MFSSGFLDISGFFVGLLINLLLIALICFYFKRKIDNLEISQSEQAKMLFKLISENDNNYTSVYNSPNMLNLDTLSVPLQSNESGQETNNTDDESDSEDESESDSEVEGETNDEGNDSVATETVVTESEVEIVGDTDVTETEPEAEVEDIDNEDDDKIKEISFNEVPPKEEIDYEKMTVSELKTLLANKGVSTKSSMKKSDIINIINENKN
uniref:Rho termination factor N-terminal domain-containing protein n=1 Tax=Florenciella sp. virus SA2 TaxID=3240092 RepID=A0AB39J6P0_9VIRU